MSIEKFFATIKDGSWHSIDELSDQLGLPTGKLAELSKTLSDHQLLQYDEKAKRIKIRVLWKLLLPAEEEQEPTRPETTIASFIVPPQNSIEVVSTSFSNLSDVEVELSLRINNQKIREVAIKV